MDLPWADSLNKYINSHTRIERKYPVRKSKVNLKDPYGTVRNSREAVVKWTKSLSMENITAIQEVCRVPMRKLGYSAVEKPVDLVNYNYLSTIDPINASQDWAEKKWRRSTNSSMGLIPAS